METPRRRSENREEAAQNQSQPENQETNSAGAGKSRTVELNSAENCILAVDAMRRELDGAKKTLINAENCVVNRNVLLAQLDYLDKNLPDTVRRAAGIVREEATIRAETESKRSQILAEAQARAQEIESDANKQAHEFADRVKQEANEMMERANQLPEGIPVFYLQGGWAPDKVPWAKRKMVEMVTKGFRRELENKSIHRTPEEQANLDMLVKGGSFVTFKSLDPVRDWLKEQNG